MASDPLENSSIQAGATSTDPARSHREFMEDRDTQSTRKRPRLDSGNLARESMATDDLAASGGENQTDSLAEQPSSAHSDSQASQRTASRVTINMKSPTALDSSDATTSHNETTHTSHANIPDGGDTSERPPDSTEDTPGQASAAISISSSPAQSPQIEVAEVEDMDQDPGTSNWRSLGDALREPSPPGVVQIHDDVSITDSFPRFRLNGELREAVDDISTMLEKGELSGGELSFTQLRLTYTFPTGHTHDTDIFIAVKNWLQFCVNNADELGYDTFLEERDFWEELPTIVESLLRRT